MRSIIFLVLPFTMMHFANAQSASPPGNLGQSKEQSEAFSSFDAASIKPNPTGGGRMAFRAVPGGRLTAENIPLRLLMQSAFGVRAFQISGGPGWLDSERYDINATAEGNPPEKQVLGPMLLALLEDRFGLKFHREIRELPVFTLVEARKGFRLSKSKSGECGSSSASLNPPPQLPLPCGEIVFNLSPAGARLRGEKALIGQLVFTLSNMLGRPVFDKTGFTERFDIDLDVSLEDVPGRLLSPDKQPADTGAPSVFTALQQQLGLKLESGKGPVEVIVIDHVEKPSPN